MAVRTCSSRAFRPDKDLVIFSCFFVQSEPTVYLQRNMGCFNSKVSSDLRPAAKKTAQPGKGVSESSQTRLSGESNKLSLKLVSDGTMSVKTLTFKHVMADPLGREYFMKFLQIEHAEENLTFFQVRYRT